MIVIIGLGIVLALWCIIEAYLDDHEHNGLGPA